MGETAVVKVLPEAEEALLRTMLTAPARALERGGLVAFPTETVYGLGADAFNARAVERVFTAKGRPADNPLIVHLAAPHQVEWVANSVSPVAQTLIDTFWPGPLTLVLPVRKDVPSVVTAGLDSVAVRCPSHLVARVLIAQAGVPLVGPSANLSGRPSPTTAAHVMRDFPHGLDWIVDGGPSAIGIESTVIDVRGTHPTVLREGKISREDLAPWLHAADQEAPAAIERSPGTRFAHYQPTARVLLSPIGGGWDMAHQWLSKVRSVGLVTASDPSIGVRTHRRMHVLGTWNTPEDLAKNLYGYLRQADDMGVEVVVIESVGTTGIGRAVMDRLRRAAGRE
ncbi:L-threonylcarbamoyladenylate synthase [Stomatohabitans albus]|uniref:L-threonylcarbamoyladenylate synthase n=1 Tax=Stomatohabitans albus TaxID=3110766 RepID=UPI00300C9443